MTVRGFAGAVAAAAGAATLAGFVPAWPLAALANLRAQLAAVLAVTGGVLALRRSWSWSAAALGGAGLNAALLAPLLRRTPGAAAPGARLELVAYNVLYRNRNYDEVIDWLRASRADVVVVVEAGGEWGRRIAKADLPFTVTGAEGERPGDGLVVLTRTAPLTTEILRLSVRPAIAVTLPLGDAHVRVLGVHPYAPTTPRGALLQEEEFEAIAGWADPAEGPVVVAGDLNATPLYPAFGDLLRRGLLDSSRGFGWQPTWSAGPFTLPIDHVLHSPDLSVHARTLGPAMGSDHRPLTVVLARGG